MILLTAAVVRSAVSFMSEAAIETLTLLEGAACKGTGNTLTTGMNGNSLNTVMSGLDGTDTINGAAGELRIQVVGNVAYVEMETNGVAGVDAMIRVNFAAPPVMHAGDFIL